jgi:hypothetical protein
MGLVPDGIGDFGDRCHVDPSADGSLLRALTQRGTTHDPAASRAPSRRVAAESITGVDVKSGMTTRGLSHADGVEPR